jgi:ABC-type nitrate/sulfonate/bicarbonate transport system substrate-binding protein
MTTPRPSTPPGSPEAVYTICPVLTASAVAAEQGWLQEELARAGVRLTYLHALEDRPGWLPHFTHSLPSFFRDGGAIPAIWARAEVSDTTLVGLTESGVSGHLAVRTSDRIRHVADLRGKRIGLPTHPAKDKVDWYRATSHRGALVTLALHGLRDPDVVWVDLPSPDRLHREERFDRPSEAWALARNQFGATEEEALRDGVVDAIFVRSGRAEALAATGRYTLLEDLRARPDWTLGVANSPWTLAVSTAFAERHPEAVIAWLRAAIRTARWIAANPGPAGEVLARVSFVRDAAEAAKALRGVDLTPTLSPRALAGIELQKQFLLDHGYLRRDFDVRAWADPRFLAEAHRSLAADGAASAAA